MDEQFNKLAPFIKEYIYNEKWEGLRKLQIDTIEYIFNTNKDILISTQTASGKTEAAIFPIVTKMYENKSPGIRCLYISPLKALINDQFIRIENILSKAQINVYRWHGDVSQYQKEKVLKENNIILQITPESIESLFINHFTQIKDIFANLEYIIIDELHYFLESIRGVHLSTLIERIEKIIKKRPRRIGLSATVGDIIIAQKYLNEKNLPLIVTTSENSTKNKLFMAYNSMDNIENQQVELQYYNQIYKLINNKKCIVFANSKKQVELTAQHLKLINDEKNGKNYILVHHGNISKVLRDEVEEKMKALKSPITAVATMTLELGIDLGDLERVIQVDSPLSINSLIQRLGRTGRKTNIREMAFILKGNDNITKIYDYPIDLLLIIAMLDLYKKEKYLEKITIDKYPYSVLIQQTLSYLVSNPGIKPSVLANLITLNAFKNISLDDYKLILKQMLTLKLIEKDQNNLIYLGEKGEKLVNNYEFYATFKAAEDYDVLNDGKLIGSIGKKLMINEIFSLAGLTWKVIKTNALKKTIEVEKSEGIATTSWSSSGINIVDTKVMKNLKYILENEVLYNFLDEKSKDIYIKCINNFKNQNIIHNSPIIIRESISEYLILPFIGTKALYTFYYLLKKQFDVKIYFDKFVPLGIFVNSLKIEELIEYIEKIKNSNITLDDITIDEMIYKNGKYVEYIPKDLLIKESKEYYLDILDLKENL